MNERDTFWTSFHEVIITLIKLNWMISVYILQNPVTVKVLKLEFLNAERKTKTKTILKFISK